MSYSCLWSECRLLYAWIPLLQIMNYGHYQNTPKRKIKKLLSPIKIILDVNNLLKFYIYIYIYIYIYK